MKAALKKFFAPILNLFEGGDGEYQYKPSHRTILWVVGGLFLTLSLVSTTIAILVGYYEAIIPLMAFLLVGAICLIVGALGSDRAVARIWGSK
ncbi:hypothetical protein [Marinimicrobium sp. ARAG 43.8]|uniref:hypothetical protein n=1 Tax=Marinimicrobium sp. ARAG 43.8 TaxID=3418719 RepID=UPI003CECE324